MIRVIKILFENRKVTINPNNKIAIFYSKRSLQIQNNRTWILPKE